MTCKGKVVENEADWLAEDLGHEVVLKDEYGNEIARSKPKEKAS